MEFDYEWPGELYDKKDPARTKIQEEIKEVYNQGKLKLCHTSNNPKVKVEVGNAVNDPLCMKYTANVFCSCGVFINKVPGKTFDV